MATNETNTTTTTMLTGAVFNDHDYVASTIFNSEENIELLLDILEEEKEFDEVVLNILDENSSTETIVVSHQQQQFKCEFCDKVTKSKGGLTRHVNLKHTVFKFDKYYNSHLTIEDVKSLVLSSIETLKSDLCYSPDIRDKFDRDDISITRPLFSVCHNLYKALSQNGNAEKFFSEYYSKICSNAKIYFPTFDAKCAALLSTKLGDKILYFYKSPQHTVPSQPKALTKPEIDGLQYLAGYVVRKLIKKSRNHKSFKSEKNQFYVSVLESFLVDVKDQTWIDVQNRGGLSAVNKECEEIFKLAENVFRLETNGDLHHSQINISFMTALLSKNDEVVSNFQAIIHEHDQQELFGEDLLQSMIELFLRVRAFSFSKDIVKKYKKKMKLKSKKGGLRKNMKKASS